MNFFTKYSIYPIQSRTFVTIRLWGTQTRYEQFRWQLIKTKCLQQSVHFDLSHTLPENISGDKLGEIWRKRRNSMTEDDDDFSRAKAKLPSLSRTVPERYYFCRKLSKAMALVSYFTTNKPPKTMPFSSDSCETIFSSFVPNFGSWFPIFTARWRATTGHIARCRRRRRQQFQDLRRCWTAKKKLCCRATWEEVLLFC